MKFITSWFWRVVTWDLDAMELYSSKGTHLGLYVDTLPISSQSFTSVSLMTSPKDTMNTRLSTHCDCTSTDLALQRPRLRTHWYSEVLGIGASSHASEGSTLAHNSSYMIIFTRAKNQFYQEVIETRVSENKNVIIIIISKRKNGSKASLQSSLWKAQTPPGTKENTEAFLLPLQVGSFSLHRYVSSFHSTEEEMVPIGQYLPCSHRPAGKTPVPNWKGQNPIIPAWVWCSPWSNHFLLRKCSHLL